MAANNVGPEDLKERTMKERRQFLLSVAAGDVPIGDPERLDRDWVKEALEDAAQFLDKANLRTFIRSLADQLNGKKKKVDLTDFFISYFWDAFPAHDVDQLPGADDWPARLASVLAPFKYDPEQPPGLACWEQAAASAFISFRLHSQGVSYDLSPDAYRKRIKRMRQRGHKLELKRPPLVSRAEFKSPNTLVVTKSDKTHLCVLSVARSTPARSNAANASGKITAERARTRRIRGGQRTDANNSADLHPIAGARSALFLDRIQPKRAR
jgi:hypothetical protein